MDLIDAKKFAAELDEDILEIDLHLSSPENFEHEIDQFLFQCSEDKVPWIKIITGIGSGVLFDKAKEFIKNHQLVTAYIEKPGALIVIL